MNLSLRVPSPAGGIGWTGCLFPTLANSFLKVSSPHGQISSSWSISNSLILLQPNPPSCPFISHHHHLFPSVNRLFPVKMQIGGSCRSVLLPVGSVGKQDGAGWPLGGRHAAAGGGLPTHVWSQVLGSHRREPPFLPAQCLKCTVSTVQRSRNGSYHLKIHPSDNCGHLS